VRENAAMPRRPEPVPDLDWSPERARVLGEGALALWTELLASLRSLPVDRGRRSDEVRAGLVREVPEEPLTTDELLAELRRLVFDYSMYPGHPGFMAYVTGAGTVPGAVAELLAAGLNQNVGGWRLSPGASEIELAVTRWLARQFGLPERAGGLLVSGGAAANLIGLKAARDARAGGPVRSSGLRGLPELTLYASEEVHGVAVRAADLLGLGAGALRKLPVDDAFRLRVETLVAAVEADLRAGRRPIAVVASAGTVATGAVDPLGEIADVCERYELWLHVDGAYGGPAVLADDLRPLLEGIERADSIAFDPHKWLYVPHSAGCVLVRDVDDLARSFSVEASYLHQDLEATGRGLDFAQLGPQFSRGFQALKVWLSLLAHGRAAYARRISHDSALARYLGELVLERPEFELAAPVGLSICCFRYVPPDLPENAGRDEYLDRLNERLMTAIQLDGRSYCSNAILRGRFVLRACIVNFRTEAQDVERLLDVAAELGERIERELRVSASV
jgi:glutamate/tyrosine decarboxylase-like PLP-dependent enzyme